MAKKEKNILTNLVTLIPGAMRVGTVGILHRNVPPTFTRVVVLLFFKLPVFEEFF